MLSRMSDTEDRIEWHFTDAGWIQGASVSGGGPADPSTVPAGRLETWEATYEVCSQYGAPVGVYAVRIWPAKGTVPPPDAAAWELLPPPWRSFGGWCVERPEPVKA